MKICGVSDIHGNLPVIPECEVLCIPGDIVGLNDQRNIEQSRHWWYNRFTDWVNRQPCEKVIITPGNHDFFIEKAHKDGWLSQLKQDLNVRTNGKLVILIDESYTYKGVKFYGSPWIAPIPYQEGKWAFELNYANSQFQYIPKDTDVLITHDNPNKNHYLLQDCTFDKKLHLFGHWHDGIAYKHLKEYNCSLLDDWYNHKKTKPLELNTIDIMTAEDIELVEQNYLTKLIQYFTEVLEGTTFSKEEIIDLLNIRLEDISSEEDLIPWDTDVEEVEKESFYDDKMFSDDHEILKATTYE